MGRRLAVFSEAETQVSKQVGRRIEEARKERDIDSKTLAHQVGISPATLCYYESGRSCCPVPVLVKISHRLSVPLVDLLPQN